MIIEREASIAARVAARTAEDAYKEHKKAIEHLSRELLFKLGKMSKSFESNSTDWSYAGSLEYVEEKLREVVEFMGN